MQLSEYRNAIERLKDDITATKKINRKLLLRIQTYEKKLELQQMKEQRTSTMLDKANEEIEKSKLEQENYFLLVRNIYYSFKPFPIVVNIFQRLKQKMKR